MKAKPFIMGPGQYTLMQSWLIQQISDPEKTYWITVEVYRKKRSREQNAYLWGVVYPTIQTAIQESRGEDYSCDDIHEWFRDKYLPKRVITIKGETKVARPSTTTLDVKEFGEYLDRIICFCAENGIVIPDPEWKEA